MMNYSFEPKNVISCDPEARIRELIGAVSAPELQQHLSAMTGLDAAQLEDVGKIDAKQLVSLCAAVAYLSRRTGCEELADAGVQAEKLLMEWMNGCYKRVDRRIHFLRNLVSDGGKDDVSSFLAEFRLFMDATILSSAGMPAFLDRLLPELEKLEQAPRITIPQCVIKRLEELAADPVSRELTGAQSGLEQLKRLHDAGLLSVRGDESDSTIMSTFISAFSRFKPTNSLVLLTEDPVMADAVQKLNAIGIEGRDVMIASISEDGVARIWGKEEDDEDTDVTAILAGKTILVTPTEEHEELPVVGEPAGESEELPVIEAPAEEIPVVEEPAEALEEIPVGEEPDVPETPDEIPAASFDPDAPTVIYVPEVTEQIPEDLPMESFLIPVPMDTPLDGIVAPASAEREQAYEVGDDDGDDAVTEESALEEYLRISSLLQVDEDDDEEDQVLYMEPLDGDEDDEGIVFTESDYKLDFDGVQFSDSLTEPAKTVLWKPAEEPAPEAPVTEEIIRIGRLAGEEDSLDSTKLFPVDPNLDWESLE